jgi:hypothetical protein
MQPSLPKSRFRLKREAIRVAMFRQLIFLCAIAERGGSKRITQKRPPPNTATQPLLSNGRPCILSSHGGIRVCKNRLFGVAGVASGNGDKLTKLKIRVENLTKPAAFSASNGVKWSLAFSPGVAVIHGGIAPIFTSGMKDRGKGLEAQSEDGDPGMLAKSLEGGKGIKSATVFNLPVGASAPGPITPGAAYEKRTQAHRAVMRVTIRPAQ